MSFNEPDHLPPPQRNHAPVWEKDAPAYCEASGVPLVGRAKATANQLYSQENNRAAMRMLHDSYGKPLYVCSMCTRPTEAYTYDGPRSRCCDAVAKVYVPSADDARLPLLREALRVEEELRSGT